MNPGRCFVVHPASWAIWVERLALAGSVALLAATAGTSSAGASGSIASVRPTVSVSVLAWGDNSAGQLGNGTLAASQIPTPTILAAAERSKVTALAAGARHDLALLADGHVLAWGDDTFGQLGNGTASANSDEYEPTLVSGLSHATAIAAGGQHSLALLADGTVEAWGNNNDGQLGNATTQASDVPVQVKGLTGVVAIAAGYQFSLAVLTNGTVEAWGDNTDGQLGIGSQVRALRPTAIPRLAGVKAVSAGGRHALALLDNGTVMAWGDNDVDQLGDGQASTTQPLSDVPVSVSGIGDAVEVSAGFDHSVALLASGAVMAWGDNSFYQLAQRQGFPGGVADSDVPLTVPGIGNATSVSAGALFTLAILSGGAVVGWGDDSFGQLGNASNDTIQQVVSVQGLTDASSVVAGGSSTIALESGSSPGSGVVAGLAPTPWVAEAAADPPGKSPTNLDMTAVSASAPNDAWAVTPDRSSSGAPWAEHWNGSAWSLTSLALEPAKAVTITGIDDLGPTDAWAVGFTGTVVSEERTVIEHWDGTTWSVVASPDPNTAKGAFDQLQAIGGTDPDNLWAVGSFSIGSDVVAVLLAHWNGSTWGLATPPNEGSIEFGEAVTVVSGVDAWVVADTSSGTVSDHFDGTEWHQVPTPTVGSGNDIDRLTGVTNVGANDVWASGYVEGGAVNLATPYLLHWTGSAWSIVAAPTAGSEGSRLLGIAALSATDLWAVGVTGESDGAEVALTEHYDGSGWDIVPASNPGQLEELPTNTLDAVAVSGTDTVIAVGVRSSPDRCCSFPLAEQNATG